MSLHKSRSRFWFRVLAIFIILVVLIQVGRQLPIAQAASFGNVSVSLSNVTPAASPVIYNFALSAASATAVQSFRAEVCTTAGGSCTTPTGFSASSALLASQPVGLGSSSGWTNDPVAGALQFKNSSNSLPPSGSQSFSFSGVHNPTNTGTYYVRLTDYADAGYSTPIDTAVATMVITPGVLVTATVYPTLTFGVSGVPSSTIYKGTLATSDRCVDSANSITFGTNVAPLVANTDYDCAQTLTTSTNSTFGYNVTIRNVNAGPVLHNGSLSIADWSGTNASPTPTPVSPSTELFGYTTNALLSGPAPDRFTASDNRFAGVTPSDAEVAYAALPVADDSVNVGFRLHFTYGSGSGNFAGKIIYTCTPTF